MDIMNTQQILAFFLTLAGLNSITCAQGVMEGEKSGQEHQLRNVNAIKKTVGQMLQGDSVKRQERPGISLAVRWCQPGSFAMGSPESEPSRGEYESLTEVTLSRGFWIAQHEVTRGEWAAVMQSAPWRATPRNNEQAADLVPATSILFTEAEEFCRRLTKLEREEGRIDKDWQYQLPSEAEWEYACRAGTATAYCFGESVEQLLDYGWTADNCIFPDQYFAHAVEQKLPNKWGIHDMHGNVWEWCRDWYQLEPSGGSDPVQNKESSMRSRRGGQLAVFV